MPLQRVPLRLSAKALAPAAKRAEVRAGGGAARGSAGRKGECRPAAAQWGATPRPTGAPPGRPAA